MSTIMSAWANPCALAQAVAGLLLSSCAHPRGDNGPVASHAAVAVAAPPPSGTALTSRPILFGLTPEPTVLVLGRGGAGRVTVSVLAEHLFLHQSSDGRGIPSNGLVAITERGLLLVDTAWTDEQTEAILRWGRDTLGRPWIGAVITHEHADRDGGLGALLRAGIPVSALDLTKDNVLFGGCLIKSTKAKDLGFTADADLAAWPAAVRRVEARYAGTFVVVPGHGDVDSRDAFQQTLGLLVASAATPAPLTQAPGSGAEPFASRDGCPTSHELCREDDFARANRLDAPGKGERTLVANQRAYLSLPRNAREPLPAILVLHTALGMTKNILLWSDRLAEEGYAVLAIDLYQGRVASTDSEGLALRDAANARAPENVIVAKEAYAWLSRDRRVQARRIALVGWSFGGAWATYLSTELPAPAAADPAADRTTSMSPRRRVGAGTPIESTRQAA